MLPEQTSWPVGTLLLGVMMIVVPVMIARLKTWHKNQTDDIAGWIQAENLPIELRTASIFMNEQEIFSDYPVPLRGRVDQVYLLENGWLVLVDTKTRGRHRVYYSDILQLSIYSMILSQRPGLVMANYGFIRTVVRTERKRSVRFHAIKLLSNRQVAHELKKAD